MKRRSFYFSGPLERKPLDSAIHSCIKLKANFARRFGAVCALRAGPMNFLTRQGGYVENNDGDDNDKRRGCIKNICQNDCDVHDGNDETDGADDGDGH